ncbi:MAG: ATP-dependent 6-phosphofructokinase [Deltaproteobacteria bacterium]|nr:MAG: ATP-dependent 6-phosphofructokinase [Deltaproteobacteria bacterium]
MSRIIGVLTGGGDCPGLNAVIRAVVKRATRDFGWTVVGVEDGFLGLMEREARTRPLTPRDVVGLLPKGGTILGTSNRANPFSGPDGKDQSERVARHVESLGLDALVCVGGDGTQTIAHRLYERYGVPVVGVPKTIDNDVAATDYTFGFDSARACATIAVDRLHSTAESHDRVMLLEVMGRDAGFIALHAGLAGGADVILLPEIPYDVAAVADAIRRRKARGRSFSVVVVAEGSRPLGGEKVYQAAGRLGGIAHHLAEALQAHIDLECRVTVLGHLQRGGSPTPFDRLLATRFGAAALDLVAEERFDQMVALSGNAIVAVSLEEAIGRPRRVDPQGELCRTARSLGICLGEAT